MTYCCVITSIVCCALTIQAADQSLESQLTAIVDRQTDAWNRGDIEGFMQAYWKSEQLTFSSGGKIERGWQATRTRYLKRYPTREIMGRLNFSELEVRSLGTDAALMLGKWKLERDTPIEGNFSLVWRRINSEWLIIHDHTSQR